MIIRPAYWAKPIELAGVPNLFWVSDSLYRSAQPTHEGMENLKKFGIKTVVNLRWLHSDLDELADVDLMHDERHMTSWNITDEDVIWFLDLITTKDGAPFLVHCQHGADRTGCMSAMYRIVIQNWTKKEAIRELEEGGFGFHELWINIPHFLREVDISKIKRELAMGSVVSEHW